MTHLKTKEIIDTDLLDHPAVKAWQELQPNSFEPTQIEILSQKSKGSVYKLHDLESKTSGVIAKRSKSEKAMIERIIYEEFFPNLNLPVPNYYGFLKEQDEIYWWLFLEDVGNQRLIPTIADHRAKASQWFGELNAVAEISELKSDLPNRGAEYYRQYLHSCREMIPRIQIRYSPDINHKEIFQNILGMCEYLEIRWNKIENFCSQFPRTVVHGDCQVKNVHIKLNQNELALFPFDWASAGWGLPATDLGVLGLPYKDLPHTVPDYETYLNIVKEKWPKFDLHAVKQLANLGQLFWSLKVICKSIPDFNHRETYLDGLLYNYNIYASVLNATIQTATWIN
jgi:thiamine kinase-like enzyme